MSTYVPRIVAIGFACILAFGFTACGGVTVGNPTVGSNESAATDENDGVEESGSYRVAYIARAQADSFAAWLANEMKSEAKDYEDITLDVFDGQADDAVENKMIENAIANRYDAIIVQPNNGEAQRPYIQQAADAGIVTITTNPRVEDIEGANSVDANPYDQGAVVAEYALDLVPEDAKVVVLTGPAGNFHSTARRDAWQETFFDNRDDVEIVAENIANWNKDEALTLMEDWSLAYPQIDAIISMNDNMAAGALEAVKGKAEFKDTLAFGVDGTPEATLLVKEGAMTATTLQNAQELAALNMESVHDLLTGEKDEVNADIGNPLITSENVEEYITLYREAGLLDS